MQLLVKHQLSIDRCPGLKFAAISIELWFLKVVSAMVIATSRLVVQSLGDSKQVHQPIELVVEMAVVEAVVKMGESKLVQLRKLMTALNCK